MPDENLGTDANAPSTDDFNDTLLATLDDAYDSAVEGAGSGDEGSPARGADGKFVAREKEPTNGSAQEEIAPGKGDDAALAGFDAAEDEAQGTVTPSGDPGPIIQPQSMSKADQEAFAKLPPDLQQWMTTREKQREADYTRKSQENARQGQAHVALDQVIAPHRETFARNGVSEAQAVAQLFQAASFADRDFIGFVRDQAVRRGVPLESLVANLTGSGRAQQQQQEPADPVLAAALRRVGGIEQHLIQQQNADRQRAFAGITSSIEAFRSEKGQDGNDLRPYFAEVEQEMIPLIEQIGATNPGKPYAELLQLAYDRAVWGNPSTREKMQAAVAAKANADALAKAAQAANRARKSAASNITSSGTPVGKNGKPMTLDETLNAAYDAAMSA